MSVLRNYDTHKFDNLIAAIFDEKYNVIEAYQIPHTVIGNYARFSQHTNAHLMRLKSPILLDERIVDIKEKMILNIKKSHNKLSLSS